MPLPPLVLLLPAAIQGVLTAAFWQHPFSTAAVCEAAARGAARNSEVMPQSICVFASLIRNAISTCCDAEAPPPGNSTRSTMLAAAAKLKVILYILPCKSLTCVKFSLVIFDDIVLFVRMILDESGSDYLSFWEGM